MTGNRVKTVIRDIGKVLCKSVTEVAQAQSLDLVSFHHAPHILQHSKKGNSLLLQVNKLLPTAQSLHLELRSSLLLEPIDLLHILVLLVQLDGVTLPLLARRRKLERLLVIDVVIELFGLARAGRLWRLRGPGGAGDAAAGASGGLAAQFLEVLAG